MIDVLRNAKNIWRGKVAEIKESKIRDTQETRFEVRKYGATVTSAKSITCVRKAAQTCHKESGATCADRVAWRIVGISEGLHGFSMRRTPDMKGARIKNDIHKTGCALKGVTKCAEPGVREQGPTMRLRQVLR